MSEKEAKLPLDHVFFRVRDLEKMYMFYHNVLGLKDVFAGHARWPRGALLSSDERHQGVELFKVDETEN